MEAETAVLIKWKSLLATTVACLLLVVLYVEAARAAVGFPLRLFLRSMVCACVVTSCVRFDWW